MYKVIADSQPPRRELLKLYVQHLPQQEPLVLVGDHTAWSRPYAVTLKDRTYEHQAQPLSGSKPVTVDKATEPRSTWLSNLDPRFMVGCNNPVHFSNASYLLDSSYFSAIRFNLLLLNPSQKTLQLG